MGGTIKTCALVRNVCRSRENLKDKDHLAVLGVDQSVIVTWALKAESVELGTGVMWLGIATYVKTVTHLQVTKKAEKFLTS
jgi:hypothetical protein